MISSPECTPTTLAAPSVIPPPPQAATGAEAVSFRTPIASKLALPNKITAADLDLTRLLGFGAYSRVVLGTLISTGAEYAVKIVSKELVHAHNKVDWVFAERNALRECDHPNIVKLVSTFSTASELFYVIEYCARGELSNIVKSAGRLSLPVARSIIAEVINALRYLHCEKGIVHRDLKSENVLLSEDWHVKLCDFATSKASLGRPKAVTKDDVDEVFSTVVGPMAGSFDPHDASALAAASAAAAGGKKWSSQQPGSDSDTGDEAHGGEGGVAGTGGSARAAKDTRRCGSTGGVALQPAPSSSPIKGGKNIVPSSAEDSVGTLSPSHSPQTCESRGATGVGDGGGGGGGSGLNGNSEGYALGAAAVASPTTVSAAEDTYDDAEHQRRLDAHAKHKKRAASFVGTAQYMAPELLVHGSATFASDLWAVGVILFYILSGYRPFHESSDYLVFRRILRRQFSFPHDFPPAAASLVDALLQIDPLSRLGVSTTGQPNYNEILNHPFFSGIDFVSLPTAPLRYDIRPLAPQWVRDRDVERCHACGKRFETFVRKHHCRRCGLIFCSRCSSRCIRLPAYGFLSKVRVCGRCYDKQQAANQALSGKVKGGSHRGSVASGGGGGVTEKAGASVRSTAEGTGGGGGTCSTPGSVTASAVGAASGIARQSSVSGSLFLANGGSSLDGSLSMGTGVCGPSAGSGGPLYHGSGGGGSSSCVPTLSAAQAGAVAAAAAEAVRAGVDAATMGSSFSSPPPSVPPSGDATGSQTSPPFATDPSGRSPPTGFPSAPSPLAQPSDVVSPVVSETSQTPRSNPSCRGGSSWGGGGGGPGRQSPVAR